MKLNNVRRNVSNLGQQSSPIKARHSCPGEYCSLVRVLDPTKDLLPNKREKSLNTTKSKRNIIDSHGRDRERACNILKCVLTKDELFRLEDSGDITRLRISGGIRPSAFKCVPKQSVERSKHEHRVALLDLQDTEDGESTCIGTKNNSYYNSLKEDMKNLAKPQANASELSVCEICFHTYRLLAQVRCLQDETFRNTMFKTCEETIFGLRRLFEERQVATVHVKGQDWVNKKVVDMRAERIRPLVQKATTIKNTLRGEKKDGRHKESNKKNVRHSHSSETTGCCDGEELRNKVQESKIFESQSNKNNAAHQEQIAVKMFSLDENTVIPYSILGSSDGRRKQNLDKDASKSQRSAEDLSCNLIVCHDLFETQERMQIYLSLFIKRHPGHKILLWNYPGQAYTIFSDTQCLNNTFFAKCLQRLVHHVSPEGTDEFDTRQPYFVMGHGQGGAVACLYAKSCQQPSLKGLLLINPLSFVDSHFASVIHDCRNVFHCSPEARPDLPLYFYSRFLFSDSYLQKTTTPLALNLYAAVHNPITLRGRVRLCDGVLDNVDLRGIVKDIFAPIISIHGTEAGLARPLHAATFLQDRDCCTTIHQALYRKGGKRTVVVTTQGGHELLQERKKTVCAVIEQLLTGNETDKKGMHFTMDPRKKTKQKHVLALPEHGKAIRNQLIDVVEAKISLQEETLNVGKRVPKVELTDKNWRLLPNRYPKDHASHGDKANMILDTDNPAFERQTNTVYKAGNGSMIYPAPHESIKNQEYMSWRLRRNRKRLSRFQRAARVIQSSLRVYMAKTMIVRLKRNTSSTTIQRCYRGMQGRLLFMEKRKELWAARFVQRAYRGSVGRKTSYHRRIRRESQIHIARVWRGRMARKRVTEILLHRHFAATNFQCLWRRYLAIQFATILRLRRSSSIVIQKIFRGHMGRLKADNEREKYLFSRSQSRGIQLGRQMLNEHKSHATKLQSELNILEKEKSALEDRVRNIAQEITNFQSKANSLEKSMQEISLVEVDLRSSEYSSAKATADVSLRNKKIKLDEDFGSILQKTADRKNQLQSAEVKLAQLVKKKEKKELALRMLERKLVALLDAQECELAEIRRKQEEKKDKIIENQSQKQKEDQAQRKTSDEINNKSLKVNSKKTAQLMESTETMMKFGFTSMTMTYFTALNMVKAMKSISEPCTENMAPQDVSTALPAINDEQSHENRRLFTKHTFPQSQVLNWNVEHVIQWLKVLSLSQYEDSFRDGSIDGPFLCQLTDDDLMNVLGVEHKLHRKKILFGISQLQAENKVESRGQSRLHTFDKVDNKPKTFSPLPSRMQVPTQGHHNEPAPISSVGRKKVELPPSLEDLSRWIRNQKYTAIKESLSSLPSSRFDPSHIRIQFMEGMGTVYEQNVAENIFHINKDDEHGNTLLHVAAQNGNLKIGKLLIEKGANPNHQNKQGQTPGHFAVAYQFYEFASWIFDENGAAGNDLIANIYGLGPYDGLSPDEE